MAKNFISSLDLSTEQVNTILRQKIKEENEYIEFHTSKDDIAKENEIFKKLVHNKNKINIVSLFSGAGGLDLGVELAGLSVKFGINQAYDSLDNKTSFEQLRRKGIINFLYSNDIFLASNLTYKENFPKTVVKVSTDIKKINHFPDADLMLGGFPCPGFSSAGPRLLDDPRNFLYIHYIRALIQSQPAFFVAENVKGLLSMGKGETLRQIREDFESTGYHVDVHLVNARDYGVPQIRERVFIIGTRKDIKKDFDYILPHPTHGEGLLPFATLNDAIGDLPLNAKDVFEGSYSPMYMSRNRKKNWFDQSFTIQASGRQAPMHPYGDPMKKIDKDVWTFTGTFNRRLSVREVARIQTFPDWFNFSAGYENKSSKNHKLNEQYKQIGNAVPVILAEKIVRPIIEYMYTNLLN